MRACFHTEIETPKGILLNALWFGARQPRSAIVWVHGLGSSLFSKLSIVDELAKADTAVLVFNNRGHDTISHLVRTNGTQGAWAGAAHEKFTDCLDDIDGAVKFVRKMGAKQIYLAGHSTGCQKSIYWAYKRGGNGVKGIMLLAPVSDYAATVAKHGAAKVERAVRVAKKMVAAKKGSELLPTSIWSDGLFDAERFLSLYTPGSQEEIFSYSQTKKPRILRSIKKPMLVLWPEKDEYSDRPAQEAAHWFDESITAKHSVAVIPQATHSFKGKERDVAFYIASFIKNL